MKKYLTVYLALLIWIGISDAVMAAPYVAYIPAEGVVITYHQVSVDDAPGISVAYALHPDGQHVIVFDVANVDDNSHELSVKACNERGCSSAVNFTIPAIPGTPVGITLVP